MKHTKESLDLTERISIEIDNKTFHHHYHILYDIVNTYNPTKQITYVEIGCYAGGSACLVLQRPNTKVISIDTGVAIHPDVVHNNVNRLNIHNNEYHYILADSQRMDTVENLKQIVNNIDVLFIDGDHSYTGVTNDFSLYSELVNKNGYIIFDDYDSLDCPEVKPAVDDIISKTNGSFNVIGTLPNIFNARPNWLTAGNDFIIQKL